MWALNVDEGAAAAAAPAVEAVGRFLQDWPSKAGEGVHADDSRRELGQQVRCGAAQACEEKVSVRPYVFRRALARAREQRAWEYQHSIWQREQGGKMSVMALAKHDTQR